MDALEQAAKYLADMQVQENYTVEVLGVERGRSKGIANLAQTYALVSKADSLHELTVQGLMHTTENNEANGLSNKTNHILEEIAHRLKERE